ncbi:MAG TPA: zf-HC2 domain-containing protein [Propionibacteriaceae bacterium]|nr:zf-HC2 domain-containing protein [Propionibacteriaceae bacterium]
MNAQHLSIDELADAAEGLLDPDRAVLVQSHLARCPECRGQSEALREVTAALRADVSPPMPDSVAHRLEEVVAAESADRADAPDSSAVGNGQSASHRQPRVTLGTFGTDLDKPRKSRWVIPALAAAAAAAVVGFGAYVISASAGLNEPPVVAAVDSRDLGAEAIALQRTSGGLSPHRFSQAWGCARQVTAGRITGLVSSSVDGTPALLVYTKSDGSTQVTVVTGCVGGKPSAGPSAVLPR